ncbi:MAG: hypothetical protein R2747_12150 [Pyrinomonadaceae bacterium]
MLHSQIKIKIGFILLLTLFLCPRSSFSQNETCGEFLKLIEKTYNFKPSKLTSEQKTAKSAEMDAVWEKVKAEKDSLLPCLRAAIRSNETDNFFKFDASNLLISLDQSDEAKKLLIDAYAKVDLADVHLGYWMPYISLLGFEGFDTSAAGENWLKFPDPEYYLPQHGGLPVNKEIGALILYGSMDEKIATPALVRIISQENHPGREIAVLLLMQQATPESFKVLKNISPKNLSESARRKLGDRLERPEVILPREGPPKITREQYLEAFRQLVGGKPQTFLKLTAEIPDGEKDAAAVLKPEDIPLVRKARRYFAAIANPHSAEWYKSFTDILMSLANKYEDQEKKEQLNQEKVENQPTYNY